jgi:phenylacetate-coenzyme A ligase PaaK-like adenylate-forming protein
MSASVIALRKTPLEDWIAHRVQVTPAALTRDDIEGYQLAKLRETVQWARARSPFYRRHLCGLDESRFRSVDDLRRIPLTTTARLADLSAQFVCVSQAEVARVVTLATSGTTGEPKRLFFTAADQERTLDFFEYGVSTLAERGDKMLIALPGERHGSVGNLLADGIKRRGVHPVPYGLISDFVNVLETMAREQVTSIIGFPVQLLSLAGQSGPLAEEVFSRLRSIVLCSDHVSQGVVRRLQQRCGCNVFEHYGSTEMGLGGGVDCEAHQGYHLREADLLFEIVDVNTGEPLPDGETGEVVFTTLSREAMPLIRYRTGDISRFCSEPCGCKSVLKNLQRIRERVDNRVSFGSCGDLTMADLDDALFEIDGLVDFAATVTVGTPTELRIVCQLSDAHEHGALNSARKVLEQRVDTVRRGLRSEELRLTLEAAHTPLAFNGAKRRIEVRIKQ